MTFQDIFSADFGPISIKVRYNKASEGPTVNLIGKKGEFLRYDGFLKGPQRHHFHINPYTKANAGETATRVEGITTPPALLEHLLEGVGLKELATKAGELEVAAYLTPANDAEVKRYIFAAVNMCQN